MICGLKLLVYDDDYLLGLQKRAVDNDHASVRMWLPGSQSPWLIPVRPSSTCTPLPSPLHEHQLLSDLCSKLMWGAGLTLTSLYCRRTDEVSEDQLLGWAGIHPGGRGRPERSNQVCLHITCPTWNRYHYSASIFQYLLIRAEAILL